jgi:hypothetical protein
MSSSPQQYDWTRQLAEAAQIPNTQANTGLTNAQTVTQQLNNQKTKMQMGFLQQLQGSMGGGTPAAPVSADDGSNPVSVDAQGNPVAAPPPVAPGANIKIAGAPAGAANTPPMGGAAGVPASTDPGATPQSASADGVAPGAPGGATAAPTNSINTAPALASARQHAAQVFAPVSDAWTPQENQQLMLAVGSGDPGAAAVVKQMHDNRVLGQNSQRQIAARQAYDNAAAVESAPDGKALAVLKRLDPATAAKYEKAGISDEQIREHAKFIAGSIYSEAKLPVEISTDGTPVGPDKKPIVGFDDAHPGLSKSELLEARKQGLESHQVFVNGVATQVPNWQSAVDPITRKPFKNVDDYVTGMARDYARSMVPGGFSTVPGQAPGGAQGPSAPGMAGPVAGPAAPGMAPSAVRLPGPVASAAPQPNAAPATAPAAPQGNAPAAVPLPAQHPTAAGQPVHPAAASSNFPGGRLDLSDAPAAPRLMQPKPGQPMSPVDEANQKDIATKQQDVTFKTNAQANQAVSSANQSLLELRKTLAVLPAAGTGTAQEFRAKAGTAIQGLFGNQAYVNNLLGDPSSSQILTKLLGADGLAATQAQFKAEGASPRLGTQMVQTIMGKLNANPDLARPAIEDMLKFSQSQAAYEKQMWGPDYARYTTAGKDPAKFEAWYGDKAPIQGAVAANPITKPDGTPAKAVSEPTAMGPKGEVMVVRNGKWVDASSAGSK